jgi:hypothetical protein
VTEPALVPASLLLVPQREDDWGNWLVFAVAVVLPVLGRLFKWVFTRLGLVREEDPARAEAERRARLEHAREERRRAESEGEELWRRLARGELPEPPPARPVPAPARGAPEERSPEERSLESEEEPRPLSVLGEVSEVSEAPEQSLESEAEPVPLEVLAQPAASAPVPLAEPALRRAPFRLLGGDLRRAIVLAEVLGPPVTERRRGA